MRLTQWTDYSLRVLMYCAASAQREQPATIGEIAEAHGISRSHLTKIVMTLSGLGLLETTRGRGGGLRLLKPAQAIVLGEVVRQTESDFTLVECFDAAHNTCRLDGHCRLKAALVAPMDAAPGERTVHRLRLVPGLPGPPVGPIRRPRVSARGKSR